MIYLFLADGFEEIEAVTPTDILRRAQLDLKTVSVKPGEKMVTGAHSMVIQADMSIDEVKYDDNLKMIILPGGTQGVKNMKESSELISIIESAAQDMKYIAAICAAPTLLVSLGLLEGRSAICFPGLLDEMKGVKIETKQVVVDGSYITSAAAGTASAFAFKIVEVLTSKEKAESIKKKMFYK